MPKLKQEEFNSNIWLNYSLFFLWEMGKVIRCTKLIIKVNVKAKVAVAIQPPSRKELHHQDIEILTSQNVKDILEVSWELSSTIQEEDALLLKLTSEILINTESKQSISLLQKDLTLDSTSSLAEKQPYQQEMSFQLVKLLKEQLSAIFNQKLVIKAVTQDAQEPMPLLLVILKMDQKLESDFPQDLEKLLMEVAELQSVLLQVEEEIKNLSWKLELFTSNTREWERDSQELLDQEWIQLTILMVVVTTNIWVNLAQSTGMLQQVRR